MKFTYIYIYTYTLYYILYTYIYIIYINIIGLVSESYLLLHYFVIQGAKLRRRNKCNAIAVKIKSAIKSVKINL